MSSNHGRLCRALMGGCLYIKDRKIIDENSNMRVLGDATFDDSLTVKSCIIEFGSTELNEGDILVYDGQYWKPQQPTVEESETGNVSGLTVAWQTDLTATNWTIPRIGKLDPITGDVTEDIPRVVREPGTGRAQISKSHLANTIASLYTNSGRSGGPALRIYMSLYNYATTSTTQLLIDDSALPIGMGNTNNHPLAYDSVASRYVTTTTFDLTGTDRHSISVIDPDSGVAADLTTPNGAAYFSFNGWIPRAIIVIGERIFSASVEVSGPNYPLQEWTRATGQFVQSITWCPSFIWPKNVQPAFLTDTDIVFQGFALDETNATLYILFGIRGSVNARAVGSVSAASISALGDLISGGFFDVTMTEHILDKFVNGIMYLP